MSLVVRTFLQVANIFLISRVQKDRAQAIDPAEVRRLRVDEKLGATEIARWPGVGRASVYRALAHYGRQA